MKIHYKESIRKKLDGLFGNEVVQDIDFVELTEAEYIQLLEELPPLGRVLLTDVDTKHRVYKGLRLKVLR